MMLKKDLLKHSGVYLVIDRTSLQGKDEFLILSQALDAGIDIVQYRDKKSSDREFLYTGEKIKNLLKEKDTLFIVDDRVDLALALECDGVHLGQEDIPVEAARKLLGKNKIIGLSTHSVPQMREAIKKDIDYISIGPIYSTPTKPEYNATGLEPLRIAAKESTIPFVAIGGINEENIEEVTKVGAKRVAVVRAILNAKAPFIATKNLIAKITTKNDSIRISKTK